MFNYFAHTGSTGATVILDSVAPSPGDGGTVKTIADIPGAGASSASDGGTVKPIADIPGAGASSASDGGTVKPIADIPGAGASSAGDGSHSATVDSAAMQELKEKLKQFERQLAEQKAGVEQQVADILKERELEIGVERARLVNCVEIIKFQVNTFKSIGTVPDTFGFAVSYPTIRRLLATDITKLTMTDLKLVCNDYFIFMESSVYKQKDAMVYLGLLKAGATPSAQNFAAWLPVKNVLDCINGKE